MGHRQIFSFKGTQVVTDKYSFLKRQSGPIVSCYSDATEA